MLIEDTTTIEKHAKIATAINPFNDPLRNSS